MRFILNPSSEDDVSAFTIRLSDEVTSQLDTLAGKLDRSRSYLATKAISDYVAREASQLAEIEAGLAEAARGDFASEAEVAAVLEKYLTSPSAK